MGAASEDFVAAINPDFIAAVLERWRGATTNQRANLDDGPMVEAEAAPLQPAAGAPDPNRFRILKKPLGESALQDPAGSPSRWPGK